MQKIHLARPVLLNAWVNASRLRRKIAERNGSTTLTMWADIHAWLDTHAPGRSLVDVGGMWGGAWGAFEGEKRGAGPVTMLDVTPPTDACLAEQDRRGTTCRFVHGDLHDDQALADVGVHDIVLCAGVLYHCPNPIDSLTRLRSITSDYLILCTSTIQELPGVPQGCLFYPGMSDEQRAALAAPFTGEAVGITTPFDPTVDYANWWWGITPSALRGMLEATGWDHVQQIDYASSLGYVSMVIARPRQAAELKNLSSQALASSSV